MIRARILVALIVLTASAHAQTRPGLDAGFEQYIAFDEPVIAMRGVHLIDGTGSESVENQTIVIQGDQILAVGAVNEVDIPESARVIDLEGHTVIPGIIGLHNHTFYTTSKRRVQLNYTAPLLYLASGVTTIRTTGSAAPYSELNLKRAVEEGTQIGPRLFVTGPYITGGSGMTYMTRLATPEDARRVVRYWAEEGVDWFKAYTLISQEELGAAIEEAHKLGIKVTGHLCSVSFTEAVALGIDNLEHGFFTNSDYDGSKDRNECPNQLEQGLLSVELDSEEVQSTFKSMIDNDVPMTSTLAVYEMYVPGRPMADQRSLDAMSSEVREEYMNTYNQIQKQQGNTTYPYAAGLFEKAQAYEYAFVEAGGLLAAGVDPTGFGGALPGFGDQRNYLLLLEAGFTPAQVIQIMTLNGAKVLGIEDTLGSVAAGKVADLVVIEGNPESNPEDISNVRYVFKDGRGYHSERLVDAVNGLVGLR
ncbi:MAG: amidohydrolase family protein [Rhodothermaceae bacterium]|nr:amidohydrolase family protein [Rhodothermaceae bacterium]